MVNDKPKIEIKEANKGKFTEYCENKGYSGATASCEKEGLASRLASVRKMAQFSKNSKKWNKG